MHKLRDYLPPFLHKIHTCAITHCTRVRRQSASESAPFPSQSAAKDQIQQHKRLCASDIMSIGCVVVRLYFVFATSCALKYF